jgi:uncharacterized surface protein with fasciclin (FAS1) repeats
MFQRARLIVLTATILGSVAAVGCQADSPTRQSAPTNMANASAPKDIVDTAISAGKFNTLVAALKAADLVDTLKGDGPFTVFAPTDEAFAKLPAGTVETLLKPENKEKLKNLLTYHVVAGKDMAADLKDGQSVKTVNGKDLMVKISDGKVMVGDAQVTTADIAASNGVIHVIDTVLMP